MNSKGRLLLPQRESRLLDSCLQMLLILNCWLKKLQLEN
ncbi:hypothetical protein RDI58_003673 [Solanum bulbocastanum]|uniref:Uncharacterized protein n=1 Tax=Solanum bulbocastanum TaxID=147425 RepID=A0AAN8YQ07_SOLBU